MHALPDHTYAAARRRVDRLLLLVFPSLPEALGADGRFGPLAGEVQAWFAPLSALPADRIAREATPFWWFNLRRSWEAALEHADTTEVRVRNLLLSAFDAFFAHLPDGTVVSANPDEGCDVVLPRLGLRVPAAMGTRTIEKTGPRSIRVRAAADDLALGLDDDRSPWLRATLAVPGEPHARVLPAPPPALFGADPRGDLAGPSFDAAPLAAMLGDARRLVRQVDPALADDMSEPWWYVPIVSADVRMHRSYTREDLTSVTYLSPALDHVLLAEAIVHEFYHTVLNVVSAFDPLFEPRDGETFYSPWRDDPRPLHGLFHAVYVFAGVMRFYARAQPALAPTAHADTVRLRRSKLHYQLGYALAQIPRDQLTGLGREIVDRIEAGIDADKRAPELFDPGVVDAVNAHLSAWSARNPELASQVRAPA